MFQLNKLLHKRLEYINAGYVTTTSYISTYSGKGKFYDYFNGF